MFDGRVLSGSLWGLPVPPVEENHMVWVVGKQVLQIIWLWEVVFVTYLWSHPLALAAFGQKNAGESGRSLNHVGANHYGKC